MDIALRIVLSVLAAVVAAAGVFIRQRQIQTRQARESEAAALQARWQLYHSFKHAIEDAQKQARDAAVTAERFRKQVRILDRMTTDHRDALTPETIDAINRYLAAAFLYKQASPGTTEARDRREHVEKHYERVLIAFRASLLYPDMTGSSSRHKVQTG